MIVYSPVFKDLVRELYPRSTDIHQLLQAGEYTSVEAWLQKSTPPNPPPQEILQLLYSLGADGVKKWAEDLQAMQELPKKWQEEIARNQQMAIAGGEYPHKD